MLTYITLSFDSYVQKHGEKLPVYRLVTVSPNQLSEDTTHWAHGYPLEEGVPNVVIVDKKTIIGTLERGVFFRKLSEKEREQLRESS